MIKILMTMNSTFLSHVPFVLNGGMKKWVAVILNVRLRFLLIIILVVWIFLQNLVAAYIFRLLHGRFVGGPEGGERLEGS
jgi:hypothetical protein